MKYKIKILNPLLGVPISFITKYNSDQFEIIECAEPAIDLKKLKKLPFFKEYKSRQIFIENKLCQKRYHRLLIRRRIKQ